MTKPIDRKRLTALLRQFGRRDDDGRVLIVDDDAEVRDDDRGKWSSGMGMTVAEAANGRSGARMACGTIRRRR